MRDYLQDTIATITNLAAPTTVLPAISGVCQDIYRITCYNSSNVAVLCQVRDTTGGSTVAQFTFPASATTTYFFDPPLKQRKPNTNWNITGTYNAHSNTSLIYMINAANVPVEQTYGLTS